MPISIDIIEDPKSGRSSPVVMPSFRSISKMLSDLPNRGVGVIWGHSIQEEMRQYTRSMGVSSSASSIVDGRSFYVQHESALRSKQYARQRYKVESFIWRAVPPQPTLRVSQETTLEFADVFDFAAAATWQQLVQFMKPRYAATRRVKDGIENDISNYLAPFRNIGLSGDIVTRWRSASPSYEDLILLWCFYHSASATKMVVLNESKAKWVSSPSVIISTERDFISVEALIEESAAFFHRPIKSVQEAFGLWQRGVSPTIRALIRDGKITEDQADGFLQAYAPLVSDDETPGLSIIVPEQQPAPLRFNTRDDKIDIVDDKEMSPTEARVIGAATGCLSALDDLESYTGFENIIPTFRSKTSRIRKVLLSLQSGDYDDNIVVQLGVEVESLDGRISASSELLSDMALAEAAIFFPIVQGLLHQFSIWPSYKDKAYDKTSTDEASQAAVEVLASTRTSSDVFTGRAKDRIEDYVTGMDSDVKPSDTGAVLVVENVAAQAASAIAAEAQEAGVTISADLLKSILGQKHPGPAGWMADNVNELQTFAETGKVSWLKAFLAALTKAS